MYLSLSKPVRMGQNAPLRWSPACFNRKIIHYRGRWCLRSWRGFWRMAARLGAWEAVPFARVPKSMSRLVVVRGRFGTAPTGRTRNPTNGRASVPAGRRASGPYRSRTFRRRQTPASPGASVPAGSASEPPLRDHSPRRTGPRRFVALWYPQVGGVPKPRLSLRVVVRGRFGTAPTGRTRTRRMVGLGYTAGRRASGPYRSRTFRRHQTPTSPGASVPAASRS